MYFKGTPDALALSGRLLASGNNLAQVAEYEDLRVFIPLSVLNPTYADASDQCFLPNLLISVFLLAFLVFDRPEKYLMGLYILNKCIVLYFFLKHPK